MEFKSELEQQVWAATYAAEWQYAAPYDVTVEGSAAAADKTKAAIARADKAVECLRAFPDLCPRVEVK